MKTIHITTCIAVALLSAGIASAKGNQGRRGGGYGGPPKTEEERAIRQEEGKQGNGGACDGQGQGKGKGQRRGPRDGSGPRGGGADCPAGK
jgi:hypothetical protein